MRVLVLSLAVLGTFPASLLAQLITNQPATQFVWAGGNATFSVGVSGSGPFTYQWRHNGTNLPQGTISSIVSFINNPSGIAVDAVGNVFITAGDWRVSRVSPNGIMTRIAGNGTYGFSGDGGPATNASMGDPYGICVDPSGNVFIADNNRIRKIDTNGIIATVAGNGTAAFSGDGGPVTNAAFNSPGGIRIDASGNWFVADTGNNRVRKVSAAGIVTTVAGTNQQFYGSYSGDGGAATNAGLNTPFRVAVDDLGNFFIADYGNARIRKVNTNGVISTVAGSTNVTYPGDGGPATNSGLATAIDVALDRFGNLFIAEQSHERIRMVDTNGIITTVAGNGRTGYNGDGGPATNATLWNPTGVAVDFAGNLFIADTFNNRIRKVTPVGGPTLTIYSATNVDAGTYQVVVTSSSGSVTSSIANLNITTAPLIYQSTSDSRGNIALHFISRPGTTNIVLCATSLAPSPIWQAITTNIAGAEGDWQFTDTNAGNFLTRFYRSQTQ